MEKIVLSILLIMNLYGCKGQEKKENKSNNDGLINMKTESNQIGHVLIKQLEYGEPSYDNPYKYNSKDLEVILPMLKRTLLSNNFKFLNNSDFSTKIKTIFGRIIDFNSNTSYLYVNFLDKCNNEFNFFPNNITDNYGVFIIKNQNYITDSYAIPQIIDYQKDFNEYYIKENNIEKYFRDEQGEEVSKYLWKDVQNLKEIRKRNIETLVARNMYLFNDSKAHFRWLVLNDEYFMRNLVTTFGYYDDKELLKWVVENTEFNRNKLDELHTVFWNKRCDGTVKVNTVIFEVLDEIITPKNEYKYLEVLKDYVYHLSSRVEKIEGLPINSRCEVMARLAYFCEKYRYDEAYKNKGFFMGRLFIYDFEDLYKKEIKKNNNYNLPKFDEYLEKSKSYKDDLFREIEGG